MNVKGVKKYILEEVAHGRPIQLVLHPKPPQIKAFDPEGTEILVDDPEWIRPELPDWVTVVRWLGEDEAFAHDFSLAEKYGAKWLADEMLELKEKVKSDPRNAMAYRTAMEMIKWSTMIRDPKYSERTVQEVKNSTPSDPDVVRAKIRQLEEELGMGGPAVIETQKPRPLLSGKKEPSQKMLAHLERAREKAEQARKERNERRSGRGGLPGRLPKDSDGHQSGDGGTE